MTGVARLGQFLSVTFPCNSIAYAAVLSEKCRAAGHAAAATAFVPARSLGAVVEQCTRLEWDRMEWSGFLVSAW